MPENEISLRRGTENHPCFDDRTEEQKYYEWTEKLAGNEDPEEIEDLFQGLSEEDVKKIHIGDQELHS